MTAPWGVDLNEDMLPWVLGELLEVVANHNLNWAVVLLWNGLAHDMSLDLSFDEFLDPGGEVVLSEVLSEQELLDFLVVLADDSHQGFFRDSEVVGELLSGSLGCLNQHEGDLALILLGNRHEDIVLWRFLVKVLIEPKKRRNVVVEQPLNGLRVVGTHNKLVPKNQSVWLRSKKIHRSVSAASTGMYITCGC